ncbi:MAG: hypothetical protein AAB336_09230 [Acidobacteriota bacterium]
MKIFGLANLICFMSEIIINSILLKNLAALTFFLQAVGFIALCGVVLYEFFSALNESNETKQTKADRRKGKSPPIATDNLPKLKPINCQNCGAGVPLSEKEMICPNCGTKSKAPENYFDVAHARETINGKLRDAAIYLKRADWLASNWIRLAIGLLVLWLSFSLVMFFVLNYHGNFEPYESWFKANVITKTVSKIAVFTHLFWIISLTLGFLSWSPRLRKTLPTIEFNENLGTSETANCSNCGGVISYQSNDLATVCGYCGVETYRAKLAWKLKNLTNSAHEKANFSIIETKKYVEDAIEEIWGTPKVLMFLLMLVVIIFGGVGLLSAIGG